MEDATKLLTDGASIAALVVIVRYFLLHIERRDQAFRESLLSITAEMARMTEAVSKMVHEIEEFHHAYKTDDK